jgi:hypothetical protein
MHHLLIVVNKLKNSPHNAPRSARRTAATGPGKPGPVFWITLDHPPRIVSYDTKQRGASR